MLQATILPALEWQVLENLFFYSMTDETEKLANYSNLWWKNSFIIVSFAFLSILDIVDFYFLRGIERPWHGCMVHKIDIRNERQDSFTSSFYLAYNCKGTEVCESMSNSIFLYFAIFNFQWLLFDSFMICKLKSAFFLHVSTKKKSTLKY